MLISATNSFKNHHLLYSLIAQNEITFLLSQELPCSVCVCSLHVLTFAGQIFNNRRARLQPPWKMRKREQGVLCNKFGARTLFRYLCGLEPQRVVAGWQSSSSTQMLFAQPQTNLANANWVWIKRENCEYWAERNILAVEWKGSEFAATAGIFLAMDGLELLVSLSPFSHSARTCNVCWSAVGQWSSALEFLSSGYFAIYISPGVRPLCGTHEKCLSIAHCVAA
jgi:hypothetical protein